MLSHKQEITRIFQYCGGYFISFIVLFNAIEITCNWINWFIHCDPSILNAFLSIEVDLLPVQRDIIPKTQNLPEFSGSVLTDFAGVWLLMYRWKLRVKLFICSNNTANYLFLTFCMHMWLFFNVFMCVRVYCLLQD